MTSLLVLASGNRGKLAEIRRVLDGVGIEVAPQSDWDVGEVEETGATFVENAILKAREAARCSGLPAMADDSGLEVDALNGAPGVHSARFAGPDADDQANNRLLLERLGGLPPEKRSARFRCVLVLMQSATDASPIICEGVWEGRILEEPRGDQGFGYDPLFMPSAMDKSSAELAADEKNHVSHRGQALASVVELLSANR